jgi:hypothetical protein
MASNSILQLNAVESIGDEKKIAKLLDTVENLQLKLVFMQSELKDRNAQIDALQKKVNDGNKVEIQFI